MYIIVYTLAIGASLYYVNTKDRESNRYNIHSTCTCMCPYTIVIHARAGVYIIMQGREMNIIYCRTWCS